MPSSSTGSDPDYLGRRLDDLTVANGRGVSGRGRPGMAAYA